MDLLTKRREEMVQFIPQCYRRKWMLHSQPGMILPFPVHWKVNRPHPGLQGTELHPAMSAIPETTSMGPQPDATPMQSISGQTTALGRYKHGQLHAQDKQQPILKAWTGSETESNKKGPSPVLIIRLGAWAINMEG